MPSIMKKTKKEAVPKSVETVKNTLENKGSAPATPKPLREKDLFYYITLYKIEGHDTWRIDVARHAQGFDEAWKIGKHPNITARKDLKVDRITGEIK